MAAVFIPYQPSAYIIHKPSSKRVAPQLSSVKKNVGFNFTDVPVEKLQISGVTSDSNLQWKVAGDFEATPYDVQASGDNLAGTQAVLNAEKHNSTDDTADGLPSMTRSLSPNYKRSLVGKRLPTKSILEPAPHSLPTKFDVDSGRRDGNVSELGKDSLLTFQPWSPRIDLENDQGMPSHGGFKVPGHVTPLNSQGQEEGGPRERQKQEAALEPKENKDLENSYNGEQRGEKRRHQEETKGNSSGNHQSKDIFDTHKTSDEDNEGPWPEKRWKKLKYLATLVGEEQHNTSQDEGRPLSTSVESTFASTANITPAAFEPAPPTEPQLAAQVINGNLDWEVRKIIGKEDVSGMLHYLVEWCPTLVPEHSLGHAKELMGKFEARLQAQRGVKNRRRGLVLEQGEQTAVETHALSSQPEKRRRGRPWKQK